MRNEQRTWQTNLSAIITSVSLLLLTGLAFDLSPWLRGDNDWRWTYFRPNITPTLLLICLGLIAWFAIAHQLAQRATLRQVTWFAFASALLIPLITMLNFQPEPISELLLRTTDPAVGGYFSSAINHSTNALLYDFTTLAVDWAPHPQRHPPGIILSFEALEQFFQRSPRLAQTFASTLHPYRCDYWPLLFMGDAQFASASAAFLSLILAAAGVFPLARLGQRLYQPSAVRYLLLLFPLIPATAVFVGHWDGMLMTIALWGLLLTDRALETRQLKFWAIAGVIFSIGTYFNYTMLVVVGCAAIYTLLLIWAEKRWQIGTLIKEGGAFLAGLSAVWLLHQLATGINFLDIYRVNTAPHFEMETNYAARLFYNPYDFALYLGFAIFSWAAVSLIIALRNWTLNHAQRGGLFVVALWSIFALLVLLGISRAEVGRVWMLLMPLFVLTLGQLPDFGRKYRYILPITLLQLLIIQQTLSERMVTEHTFTTPSTAVTINTGLGEQVQLAAWQTNNDELTTDETLIVQLYWRAQETVADNYIRFVHVYHPEHGVVAQSDAAPHGGQYPTSCWLPDEIVSEVVDIPLSAETPTADYQLLIGMYSPDNPSERLPTANSTIPGTIELPEGLSITPP